MLRLGVVSDIHWCPEVGSIEHWHHRLDFAGVPDRLRAALTRFRADNVDAVVLLGDLVQEGDQGSLDAVAATCAEQWTGPTFFVTGNHDGTAEARDVPGQLDPQIPVRKLEIELDPKSASLRAAAGAGKTDRALPVVLLSHYPLLSQEALLAERGFKYAGRLPGADDVLERLQDRAAPAVILCGHVHARESRAHGNVLQLTTGALAEPPYECAVVEIGDSHGRLEVRRACHRLGGPAVLAEPVFAADDESWEFADRRWTYERGVVRVGVTA
jgi:predicted phosphodiesterase